MKTEVLKTRKSLTIKEALDQGYTHCGFEDYDYQSLRKIEHVTDQDFNDPRGKLVLVNAEACYTPSIKAKDIAEMIAERMESDNGEQTNDDTEEV